LKVMAPDEQSDLSEPPAKRTKSETISSNEGRPEGLAQQGAGGEAGAAAVAPPHTRVRSACSEDKGPRQAMEDVWVANTDARSDAASPLR
jgi:hypothetical protein